MGQVGRPTHRRALRVLVAAVAAMAFLLYPFAKPADAQIGTVNDSGIYFTRDSNWNVHLTGLNTATTNSAYYAIDTVYGTTNLDPNTTTGTSCATSTDLCVFDYDYGIDVTWRGIADCTGTLWGGHPNMACSHHRVRINLYHNPYAGYRVEIATSKRTLCHEIGHAVGLWHHNSNITCMEQWEDGTGDLEDYGITISSTERSELNGHYK